MSIVPPINNIFSRQKFTLKMESFRDENRNFSKRGIPVKKEVTPFTTLVNVYVGLLVFTHIAGTS